MRLLFVTTFQQSIPHEHIFTRNLWFELRKHPDTYVLSIFLCDKNEDCRLLFDDKNKEYSLYINSDNPDDIIREIEKVFVEINPSIIHSNMIEGYDIKAAIKANIPIVLTMHIGGLICARGGGNGLLNWKDEICKNIDFKKCELCCYQDFPLPKMANILHRLIPLKVEKRLNSYFSIHKYFYISPLLNIRNIINERQYVIDLLRQAHVISANEKLSGLLNSLNIPNTIIPHGIKQYERVKYPIIKDDTVIKFFYLARIQYSKGLHILLEALKGIPTDSYELHILGDAYSPRKEQMYKRNIIKKAKHANVVFHGFVENDSLSDIIADYHVMIHPTICHEIYGINISEALSLGRPVVATKCGGPEMQIREDYNGWLVEPNNVAELKSKIQKIIAHKTKLNEMSSNCHCPNTLKSYVTSLFKLYNNLICTQHK